MVDTNKVVILPKTARLKQTAELPISAISEGNNAPKSELLSNVSEQSIRNLRDTGNISGAIRQLSRRSGVVSTALFNMVQVANSGYTLEAYNSSDHSFSREGVMLAQSVVATMDRLYDYTKGYSDKTTTDSCIESALREVAISSGLGCELVLNKERFPDKINIVSYESLRWQADKNNEKYPVQQGTNGEVPLNNPNFWVAELHKDTTTNYARPLLEAGLDTAFYFGEFVEDMRRAVRRTGHGRLIVTLDLEAVIEAAPDEVQADEEKLKKWIELARKSVEDVVSSMEPEQALVTYDTVTTKTEKSEGEKADYKDLLNALSGLLATSLKTNPSILGLRIDGSQSLSNTESLIYLKAAKALHGPVESVMSRALTLAVRLYGLDVYVDFKFNKINLRPDDELEAFKTMKQSRVLELLSLGMMTEDEASMKLTGHLRPEGGPELFGTMFHEVNNRANEASPNADPMGRALQPDTPSNGGGKSQ